MDLKTKLKGSVFYTIYFSIRKKWANRWDVRSKNTLKKDGSAILCELEDILNSYGISHFFDFGTLLGIVRENGIIPGDGDIDIGVIINSNDDKKKIEQLENNKTIRKVRQFFIEKYGVAEESYFFKNKVRFDLHYYYGEGSERFCFLFYRLPENSYSNSKVFDSVKVKIHGLVTSPFSFNSKLITLPNNPEDIIVQKYGDNWRTPDSGWPYWEGPCSEKIPEKGTVSLFLR